MLRCACTWTQRWLQTGHQLVVSVNVSPVQFGDRTFPSTVAAVLRKPVCRLRRLS